MKCPINSRSKHGYSVWQFSYSCLQGFQPGVRATLFDAASINDCIYGGIIVVIPPYDHVTVEFGLGTYRTSVRTRSYFRQPARIRLKVGREIPYSFVLRYDFTRYAFSPAAKKSCSVLGMLPRSLKVSVSVASREVKWI